MPRYVRVAPQVLLRAPGRTRVVACGGGGSRFSRESRCLGAGAPASSAQPFVTSCGAEPPFPLSRCRRRARLVGSAVRSDPALLDRQDRRRSYYFRPSSRATEGIAASPRSSEEDDLLCIEYLTGVHVGGRRDPDLVLLDPDEFVMGNESLDERAALAGARTAGSKSVQVLSTRPPAKSSHERTRVRVRRTASSLVLVILW